MPETVVLVSPAGASPDWDAARDAIEGLDELGKVDDLAAYTWPQYDIATPDGDWVTIAVLPILHEDLNTIEEAFHSPPEGLSALTCEGSALIHLFDRDIPDVKKTLDACDRLYDFDVLAAAGLIRGTW